MLIIAQFIVVNFLYNNSLLKAKRQFMLKNNVIL